MPIVIEGDLRLAPYGRAPESLTVVADGQPLLVQIREALKKVGYVPVCLRIQASGAVTKEAVGPWKCDHMLLPQGLREPLVNYDVLTVGDRDVFAYLQRLVGRHVRVEIRRA